MAANVINQLSTANTFQHWLNATESLIATANLLTNGNGSTFYANTRLEVGGTNSSTLNVVTSASINVLYANVIIGNTLSGNIATVNTSSIIGVMNLSQGGTNASSFTTGNLIVSNGTALISLANTGTAGTYGNSTCYPVITTDAYGRVTSVVNTAISSTQIWNSNNQVYLTTVDGSTSSFNLGFSPNTSNNMLVTIDGIVQYDYSVAGSTLTLNFTPPNNSRLRVQSYGYIQSTSVTVPTWTSNGNLVVTSGNSLIALANVGSAGTYGNTKYVPVITTDAYGRISAVTNTAISFSDASATTYGNSSYHPVITIDSLGRISSITNTAISISTVTNPLTANSFIPSSTTIPQNGMYLAAANSLGFSANSIAAFSVDANGSLNLAGSYTEGVVSIGNSGTTQTLSLANGTYQTVTLNNNCTFTMPAAAAGKSFILAITQDGTGGRTATFTSVKWPAGSAPTITSDAYGSDLIGFFSNTTTWFGVSAQNFS